MAIKQSDAGVRAASKRFYGALTEMANGNAEPMRALWPDRDDVTTMHPIGGREVGYDAVAGSWQGVAEMASGGEVKPTDQFIRVVGDLAYEIATEQASMTLGGESIEGSYRVTNVYERDGDEWHIVHHHADLDPAFVDLVQRLAGK